MNKISEFYAKALADENAKKELIVILGDNKIESASDEQLTKVGELAKKLGYDISIEEAKDYLSGNNAELDEDDLDAVAGGCGLKRNNRLSELGEATCGNGIGNINVNL